MSGYTTLLASPSAAARARGIDEWGTAPGDSPELVPLLEDDAPLVHVHAGRQVITEVRAAALVALQDRYRLVGRAWDLGEVTVRKAMPADEAVAAAASALVELAPDRRAAVEQAVERAVAERVRPTPTDAEAVRAYVVLQKLGQVPYLRQPVDPETLLTALQREVYGSQLRSERPRPHLRCEGADGPVGFVYRAADGRWVLDFDESPVGRDIRGDVDRWMHVEKRGVPRVTFDADGQPVTDHRGAFVLDGVVPNDTEQPLDFLRSVGAFVARRHRCAVVPRQGPSER